MGFIRTMVSGDGRLPHPMRAGDGLAANFQVYENAADAILTLTTAILSGGKIAQTTTLTADRIFTTDTAENLVAAFPEMDVGDAFSFVVSNGQTGAFDIILAGGTGVTLKGAGNVGLQCSRVFTLVCTNNTSGTEAFDLY